MSDQQIVVEFVADTSGLDAAQTKITDQQKQAANINQQNLQQFNATNQQMITGIDKTTSAAANLNKSFKDLAPAIAQTGAKQFTDEMSKQAEVIGKAATEHTKFRARLLELKNGMRELQLQGKSGTEQFEAMSKEAAKMQLAMRHVADDVNNASQKFLGLKAAGEVIRGIGAGFEVVVGAEALFGSKNEELEKTMKTLLGTMALVNGLTEISTALERESAISKEILKVKTYAYTTALKVLGITEEEVAGESAAAWAVATGGIAVLIAAVAGAIYWVYSMSGGVKELTESEKAHNKVMEDEADKIANLSIEYLKAKGLINDYEAAQLKLDHALIKSKEEVIKKSKEAAEQASTGLVPKLKQLFLGADDGESQAQQYWRAYNATYTEGMKEFDAKTEAINAQKAVNTENEAKRIAKELGELRHQADLNYLSTLADTSQKEIAILKTTREWERKSIVEKLENDKASTEDSRKILGAFDEQTGTQELAIKLKWHKKLLDELKAHQSELKKRREEYNKEQIESVEAARTTLDPHSGESTKLFIQEQQMKADAIKKNNDLTLAEQKIQLKKLDDEIKAHVDAELDYKLAAIEKEKAAYDADYANDIAASQRANDAIIANNKSTEAQKKAATLSNLYIKQDALQAQINDEEEAYDKEILLAKDNADKLEEIERDHQTKMNALKKGQIDTQVDIDNALHKNKKITAKQAEKLGIDVAQKVATSAFQIADEARQKNFDAQMQALEKEKSFELNNKNLTEAQKRAIDNKYAQQERQLKLKNWEADKKSKLESAIINTALSITAAATTVPFIPDGIIAMATAAASGAAQVAVISASKAPAFAKGTKNAPAGMKWVGEEGPELINDKGGYAIISHPDSMKIMDKYDIPSMPSFDVPMPNLAYIPLNAHTQQSDSLDYNKLAGIIADKLKENPQTVVNIDKGGLSVHIREKGKYTEKMNNRFRSR